MAGWPSYDTTACLTSCLACLLGYDGLIHSVSKGVSEWLTEWVGEWLTEWVGEWLTEWVGEWLT